MSLFLTLSIHSMDEVEPLSLNLFKLLSMTTEKIKGSREEKKICSKFIRLSYASIPYIGESAALELELKYAVNPSHKDGLLKISIMKNIDSITYKKADLAPQMASPEPDPKPEPKPEPDPGPRPEPKPPNPAPPIPEIDPPPPIPEPVITPPIKEPDLTPPIHEPDPMPPIIEPDPAPPIVEPDPISPLSPSDLCAPM